MWLEEPDEILWELSLDNYDDEYDPFEKQSPLSDTQCHEKIKNTQKRAAKQAKTKDPTKVKDVYWLYEDNKDVNYPHPTYNSGKWLIFEKPTNIFAAWKQVQDGIKTERLGSSAKVSTRKGWRGRGTDYVICVYTYDWKDEKDVMRIREELRDMGFEKLLPYKADEDTLRGKYSNKGSKGISKYYE